MSLQADEILLKIEEPNQPPSLCNGDIKNCKSPCDENVDSDGDLSEAEQNEPVGEIPVVVPKKNGFLPRN